jgi:hypothetical protein
MRTQTPEESATNTLASTELNLKQIAAWLILLAMVERRLLTASKEGM